MYKTDFAIKLTTSRAERSFAADMDMLDTIERDILPSIRSGDFKLINFHGASGTGKSRLASYCANFSGWPVYGPQLEAAPLQRLIFGQGIELSFEFIRHLSTSQETIVLDHFDKIKSKIKVLDACRGANGQFIFITREELPNSVWLEANIGQYLSVKFSAADEPPVISEREVSICMEDAAYANQ